MSSMDVSNLTKETLNKMFSNNLRFDGRGLTELRDISIEYGVSNKAEGSARVRMGKTDIVVGVKLQVGEPYPDSLDKGNLMVSGDLLPLASPRFEQGPPNFQGIELPRLIDRAVRESGIIDLSKLVIKEGEKVWTVIIDIYPLNDDGNLIDASTIGAVAALRNAKLPALDENGSIDYKSESKEKLPLSDILPISFSFFKLGDNLILDPTREEEEACDARITFGASKLNGEIKLNSCQKAGEATFTQAEIEKIMDLISEKYGDVEKSLQGSVSG